MKEKDDVPRSRLTRLFHRLRRNGDPDKVTEETLSDLEHNGHIDEDESEMIEGILYLDKTTVREIMVPRTEIQYVDREMPIETIIAKVLESGHSRLPVVDGDIDEVLGFVHAKDLLRFWSRPDQFHVDKVLRRPYNVPESKKLDDLLTELQERREQIALVIDEFGGTSGLVSIEDILEEIVGEIVDEYDKEESIIFHRDAETLVVAGRFDMDEVCDHFQIPEPDGSFNTVGGWIFERIGRVPQAGEIFQFDGMEIKVEVVSDRHIRRVRLRRALPAVVS